MTQATPMWRCLIVEDDADNARYIADGFRALGHVAVIARDGGEALARVTGEAWDLVILDRMLPNEVDGLSDLPPLVVPFITRKSGVARLIDLGGV
jgi:two-component system OmpR family response regulator